MEKHVRNSVIYSNDPGFLNSQEQWALGYGIKKYFFNRSLTPGMNRRYFYAYGLDLMHINHKSKKVTRELSLLMRPGISVGSKLHPRNKLGFLFAAVSYNFYKSASNAMLDAIISSGDGALQHWPGFSAGILID